MIAVTCATLLLIACAVSGQDCPEEGVFGWAHETACDEYYKCENGTFSQERCPNGLVFDEKEAAVHDLCTWNWKVDCGKKTQEPPISSPGCPYQFGIFPSESCTQYIRCAWGEANVTDCEEGLAYQEETHTCVWPDEVAGCDSEAIVGFRCPTHATGLSAKFYPFPRYPHPHDCQKLIVCVGEKPRLLNCGYGSAFNPHTYTCDSIDNVPECHGRF
ncbi:hypothetical protein JTE90_012112 [Oedothorax gibbosus]|uniref:Chitin-binding type-2 domain-containing protein n=1 Tax=Oedothorax gibbosus TaxID=931172 RepID=A0AAV6UVR5_9ARAC|nr:hypothetical protein JTE90_012112 [Oedothorax gibbosus]